MNLNPMKFIRSMEWPRINAAGVVQANFQAEDPQREKGKPS